MIALLCALSLAQPDRSGPPEVAPAEVLAYDEFSDVVLSEHVRLRHVRVPGLRKVTVEVHGWRGTWTGGRADKAADAAAWLWDAATWQHDGGTLRNELALLGGSLWSSAGYLQFRLGVEVRNDALEPGIRLLSEVLRTPRYHPDDVRRYRREERVWRRSTAEQDPTAVTNAAVRFATYGPEHPFGQRPRPADLRALVPRRLHRAHQDFLAGPLEVLVVGDVPLEAVRGPVAALMDGLGGGGRSPELPTPDALDEDLIGVIAPGSPQATIRVRLAAPPFGHPDHPAVAVLNEALGGAFYSRLNRSLREERGWTYGAWSDYAPGRVDGKLTLGVDVPAERVGETLDEITRILDALALDGVTAEELDTAVQGSVASWNQALATSEASASFYASRLRTPESVAQARARLTAERALTVEDVRQVARQWLAAPRLVVLVGDPATLVLQLAERDQVAEWILPSEAVNGSWME